LNEAEAVLKKRTGELGRSKLCALHGEQTESEKMLETQAVA
jgi:hypothetical protein